MRRLAVLASGGGSLTDAVLAAAGRGDLPLEAVAVVTDRRSAGVLDVASRHGVTALCVAPADHPDRAAWDAALAATLRALRPDWVASLGFMRVLGPGVLAAFPDRILNTHPALLPAFPGAHAVRDALAYGVAITGCTVHLVDEGVDTGPVLAQRAVDVRPGDDEAALHERIKEVERPLVVDVLATVARDGLRREAAGSRRLRPGPATAGYARRP
ncbi:MAG: phosphoribosylglycinamide formyltransferase [Kineosporiaceae bacterium]